MILSPLNFIKMVWDMIPFRLRWAEASCIWVEKAKTLFSYVEDFLLWYLMYLLCTVLMVDEPLIGVKGGVPQVNTSVEQILQNKNKKKNKKRKQLKSTWIHIWKNWICSWINIYNPCLKVLTSYAPAFLFLLLLVKHLTST